MKQRKGINYLKENQEVREIEEDVNEGVIIVYEDNLSELSVDNEEEMDALFDRLEEMSIQELAFEQIVGFARIYRDDEDQIQISDIDYREEEFKNGVDEIVNEYLGKNDSYKAQLAKKSQPDPLQEEVKENMDNRIKNRMQAIQYAKDVGYEKEFDQAYKDTIDAINKDDQAIADAISSMAYNHDLGDQPALVQFLVDMLYNSLTSVPDSLKNEFGVEELDLMTETLKEDIEDEIEDEPDYDMYEVGADFIITPVIKVYANSAEEAKDYVRDYVDIRPEVYMNNTIGFDVSDNDGRVELEYIDNGDMPTKISSFGLYYESYKVTNKKGKKVIKEDINNSFEDEIKEMEKYLDQTKTGGSYIGTQLDNLIDGYGRYEDRVKYLRYFMKDPKYKVTPIDAEYGWEGNEDYFITFNDSKAEDNLADFYYYLDLINKEMEEDDRRLHQDKNLDNNHFYVVLTNVNSDEKTEKYDSLDEARAVYTNIVNNPEKYDLEYVALQEVIIDDNGIENVNILDDDYFNSDLYESVEQPGRKLADVEDKDQGKVPPVYADAVRGLKKADKEREEARKLNQAPKRDEKPKNPKMVSGAKKMHLDESLFDHII